MQLSKMQDLGGCRAVLKTVKNVNELVRFYEQNPCQALEFVKKFDYVACPKDDGYRSVHMVYRYQGNGQGGAYKGLKIEIQIRSRLQHAWATALEIIDTFTGQGLKSNLGEEIWKRFFALMGTAMAMNEKCAIVPNTPNKRPQLVSELREVCQKLNIPNVFYGLTTGLGSTVVKQPGKAEAYILTLDSKERMTSTEAFSSNKYAEQKLLELEKENIDKPHIQSVMASAESVHALRAAYPNYYLDTKQFIGAVVKVLK
jgi:hypothetical protein